MTLVDLAGPMRGTVEGLPTPCPIGDRLPAALQDDEFCVRMVAALDEVLAPVFTTLDCFDSYLDAQLAPEDFVEWLARWVGLEVDETWSLERRRELIRHAGELYRIRGTAAGLAAHVRLYAGSAPEIRDNGGVEWSQTADTPFPGSGRAHLKVTMTVGDESEVKRSTLRRIVDACRPAHIPAEIEIVVGGTTLAEDQTTEAGSAPADAPGAVALPGSESIELAAQGPTVEDEQLEAEGPPTEPTD